MNTIVAAAPVVNIVVPCYNEEEVLPETSKRLRALIERLVAAGLIDPASGIYFVDDGSKDATWALIEDLTVASRGVCHGIKLSRNQGHQSALLAGLRATPGDALVSIDADLQDDIEVIETMIRRFREGCDIVYGVRVCRATDTGFKRGTARGYYGLLRRLGVDIVPDHADFRLMSRRALQALTRYTEVNVFLRAIVPQLGFRSAVVTYDRAPRFAGVSKYPLGRMLSFALDGITSFSMQPLRLITITGLVVSLAAFGIGAWAIVAQVFFRDTVPGWASIVSPLSLIGGLQLLSLGVIGEYIGKIYLETKRRPHFEIETTTFVVGEERAFPPPARGEKVTP